jgi:AcrR family transcriptional regulator
MQETKKELNLTEGLIQPRIIPKQTRAEVTVKRVLDATVDVLVEMGHEKITTTGIAERSGVNIASLYRYFPNKLSLLHAVAQRFADQLQAEFEQISEPIDKQDICDYLDERIDTLLRFHRTTRGATAASRAMQSNPSLRIIDHEQDLHNSKMISQLLANVGVKASTENLEMVALLRAQVVTAVLDNALRWDPDKAETLLNEVKLMQRLHIEHYMRQEGSNTNGSR